MVDIKRKFHTPALSYGNKGSLTTSKDPCETEESLNMLVGRADESEPIWVETKDRVKC